MAVFGSESPPCSPQPRDQPHASAFQAGIPERPDPVIRGVSHGRFRSAKDRGKVTGLSANTERRELGTKEVTADSADRDGTWVSIEPHEPTCLCGHARKWSDHRGVQSKRTACLWEHTHTQQVHTYGLPSVHFQTNFLQYT